MLFYHCKVLKSISSSSQILTTLLTLLYLTGGFDVPEMSDYPRIWQVSQRKEIKNQSPWFPGGWLAPKAV